MTTEQQQEDEYLEVGDIIGHETNEGSSYEQIIGFDAMGEPVFIPIPRDEYREAVLDGATWWRTSQGHKRLRFGDFAIDPSRMEIRDIDEWMRFGATIKVARWTWCFGFGWSEHALLDLFIGSWWVTFSMDRSLSIEEE